MLARTLTSTGLLLGGTIGAAAAVFGSLVTSPMQAAALPAAIALFFFLLLDRRKLLLAILVLRSAGDVFLEATRFSLFGYHVGVGGVINAIVILLVGVLIAEKPRVLPKAVVWAWAGFLLAALLGVLMSPIRADALRIYLSLLSYFAVFAGAFYLVRSSADFGFCVRMMMWSSVIPVLYALAELATGSGHSAEGLRLKGTFAHPNIFAFYLVLVISLTLFLIKSAREPLSTAARSGLVLYMMLLLALLLLTKTRSAWVACFLLFVVYGLFEQRRYLLYVLLAPFLAAMIPGVQDRVLDLAAGNEYVQYAKLNSFAWRRLIWESGLKWMQPDHYLLGYGLESFRHHSTTFFPLASPAGLGFGAHSVYVQVVFEMGVLGLAAYLWLFARLLILLKSLLGVDRLAAIVVASLTVVYMVISAADNMLSYLSFNWYFWFLGGAGAATAMSARVGAPRETTPGRPRTTPGKVPARAVA